MREMLEILLEENPIKILISSAALIVAGWLGVWFLYFLI